MRLHTLALSAFGPFPEEVHIDFDSVAEDGLFLIAGPTGAGKTSILDALTFALYGRVPGERNRAAAFRSHFAAPDTRTWVRLEFSARGRRWRVERSPAYERPSKRDRTKLVAERPTALLSVFEDGEWAGRARTMADVQAQIQEAIGLGADQFSKIILLPQGDFAAFLEADPREREPLLQKLFGTGVYEQVARVLEDRAKDGRTRIREISEARRYLAESVREEIGEPLPAALPHEPSIGDVMAVLSPARAVLRERLEVARTVCDLAQATAHTASAHAARVAERIEDRRRLRALEHLETAHAADSGVRTELRSRLDRARRAAAVVPTIGELSRAEAAHAHASETLRTAEAHLGDARTALGPAVSVPTVGSARALHARAAARRTALSAEQDLRTVQEQDTAELDARAAALTALDAELEALDTEDDALAPVRADAPQVERDAVDLGTAREEHRRANELLTRLTELDAGLRRAREELARARDVRDRSRAHHEDLVTRRLAGIAGELAATLSADSPCPVCGSCVHPHPASPGDSPVTPADVENALGAWTTAAREYEAAATSLRELETARAGTAGALGDRTAETLAAEGAALESRTCDLESRTEAVRTARSRTAALQEQRARLTDRKEIEARAVTSLRATIAERAGRLAALGADEEDLRAFRALGLELPDSLEDAGAMETAAGALVDALEALTRAREALTAAEQEVTARREARDAALEEQGFSRAEEVETATASDVHALESELRGQQDRAARIEALRSEGWWDRARTDTASDDRLAAARAEAEAVREKADRDCADARGRLAVAEEHLERLSARSTRFLTTEEPREGELTALRDDVAIAGLVHATSPDNTKRMTLTSYALAALFADVAAHASERLVVMSAGRYRLVHDVSIGKGEKKAGLGLRVFDAFTQETRDTRSLSGGEGFMASLALALGLADTVAGTRGGVELDSLFIDEGFGSLDPDALAEVMRVLDELRAGGRTVGVISHVQAMQQSIPAGITVRNSPTGSRVHQRDATRLT